VERTPARWRGYVGFHGLRIFTVRPVVCKASDRKTLVWRNAADYHARLRFCLALRLKPMRVLGLETCCDETGVALYD
ncbi:hypothetical protein, partial [Pseudomonas aeruginosa]|uniref:hypothetical protein n=1 Tax=Pseudomonas aeruginosa TaxID=287 RepID=UPI003CC5C4F3